jgi:glycosidase
MMVDRFFDGDTSINRPVIDPKVDYRANYQGGDLEGIRKKLEEGYFKALGVNTLWISPIVTNPEGSYQEYPAPRRWFSGYHGYWPVQTTVVDHRFGSNEGFGKLVDQAHAANMNVLVDFVSNHVHQENKLFKEHPEWFSSMYTKDGKVNIRIWDAERLTTWFDTFMPDIDYTKPEAVNAFSDSAMFWIEKYKIDGFRHDATKHVSETFWRALTRKMKQRVVKKEQRNVYQIGETFGSRELIGSYIGSGMMDAQFDFNLYFDARPVFAGTEESFEKVAASLKESALYYGSHSLMGNITGNHDMPRFLYYAGGAARPGEDDKEAGWSRDIKVEDPRGYARLKMLEAFILTIPGIPVIYYGDEIGMPGANDPDNRRMMRFSGLTAEEQDVMATVKKLTALRRSSMPLLYGSTRVLQATKDQLVFVREYLGKSEVVALNRAESPSTLTVNLPAASKVRSTFTGNSAQLTASELRFTVKPLSFEIISID